MKSVVKTLSWTAVTMSQERMIFSNIPEVHDTFLMCYSDNSSKTK